MKASMTFVVAVLLSFPLGVLAGFLTAVGSRELGVSSQLLRWLLSPLVFLPVAAIVGWGVRRVPYAAWLGAAAMLPLFLLGVFGSEATIGTPTGRALANLHLVILTAAAAALVAWKVKAPRQPE